MSSDIGSVNTFSVLRLASVCVCVWGGGGGISIPYPLKSTRNIAISLNNFCKYPKIKFPQYTVSRNRYPKINKDKSISHSYAEHKYFKSRMQQKQSGGILYAKINRET